MKSPQFKPLNVTEVIDPKVYAIGAAGFWLSRHFRQAEIPVSPECDNALDVWEQPL